MKTFSIEFNLRDGEFLTALRLVAGAVCSTADVDLDLLEDFKVCVTESSLILKNGGFESVKAVFNIEDGVSVIISGVGGNPSKGDYELSLALIKALVTGCEINSIGGIIDKVTLKI